MPKYRVTQTYSTDLLEKGLCCRIEYRSSKDALPKVIAYCYTWAEASDMASALWAWECR
jgi:hypothetical protein